jgi:hypothetical protein
MSGLATSKCKIIGLHDASVTVGGHPPKARFTPEPMSPFGPTLPSCALHKIVSLLSIDISDLSIPRGHGAIFNCRFRRRPVAPAFAPHRSHTSCQVGELIRSSAGTRAAPSFVNASFSLIRPCLKETYASPCQPRFDSGQEAPF